MSPIQFTPRPSPTEPRNSMHDTLNSSNLQRRLSAAQDTGGYHLPEAGIHSPHHGVDLPTLNYCLDRPMQRTQDYSTGWPMRQEPTFSPYTYGDADASYGFSINNQHGADDDPFAPRTTYPCDPRVIFNQSLDDTQYDYPTDLQRQDQYALFGYGDPPEQHNFSRLSISHSPAAGEHDYANSRSSSRYPSPSIHGLYSGTPNGGDDDAVGSCVPEHPEHDGQGSDEPYAKLIYKALMEKDSHAMVLKDIYKWFEENTDKASHSGKGWQNSIRHNLSMNGAFKKHEREPSSEDGKKYCEWVLEPSAIIEGVKSTTRYRKPTGPKNRNRSDPPAPIRQYSGRLGGQANRQQSQKRKFQDRLDRDIVLGQVGRSDRYESSGRFGTDRFSSVRAYSPATPRTVISRGDSGLANIKEERGLGQCPPTPKSEFEDSLSPFFFSGNAPTSKDVGNGVMGIDGLLGGDYEILDGLPTPSDCVASLGEVASVCVDNEEPVFVDDHEGEGGDSTGPGHCPRMWENWQYFEADQ